MKEFHPAINFFKSVKHSFLGRVKVEYWVAILAVLAIGTGAIAGEKLYPSRNTQTTNSQASGCSYNTQYNCENACSSGYACAWTSGTCYQSYNACSSGGGAPNAGSCPAGYTSGGFDHCYNGHAVCDCLSGTTIVSTYSCTSYDYKCGGGTPPSPTPGPCTTTCNQTTQCQRTDNNCSGNWGSSCGTASDGTPKKYCTEQYCTTYCAPTVTIPPFIPSVTVPPATRTPTRAPTRTPTRAPTRTPTRAATRTPTRAPTRTPTHGPTRTPTRTPTRVPTRTPTPALSCTTTRQCVQWSDVKTCVTVTPSSGTTLANGNCTLSFSYWKSHASLWPISSMTLGTVSYSKSQLLLIINNTTTSYLGNLANQLIAAKLNIAHGASSSVIYTTISQANSAIGSKVIPPIGSGTLSSTVTSPLVSALYAYNTGSTGPGSCTLGAFSTSVLNIDNPIKQVDYIDGKVVVTFSRKDAKKSDWIGIYSGSSDPVAQTIDWKWLNDLQNPIPSESIDSGSVTFALTGNEYTVRYINSGNILGSWQISF